jgi:hypothetical protein
MGDGRKFHTQRPQLLNTAIENLFVWVTRCLAFVHPCCKTYINIDKKFQAVLLTPAVLLEELYKCLLFCEYCYKSKACKHLIIMYIVTHFALEVVKKMSFHFLLLRKESRVKNKSFL